MAVHGRGARIKGKNFERKIAKQLSDWYSEIKGKNITLRRVPNSGGLNIKGDIMTEDVLDMKEFPLHLELKNQERWNVRDYYSQSENDCPSGKIPTVIFSKNNDHSFIMLKLEDFIKFTKELKCQVIPKNPIENSVN